MRNKGTLQSSRGQEMWVVTAKEIVDGRQDIELGNEVAELQGH